LILVLLTILNEQDEIIGAVLTMRDISARKQAEIELSEARQNNQQYIDSTRKRNSAVDG
jgi:hypothetical protein